MKNINVLLIDDDALIQNFAALALGDRGMTIWSAYNTAEADAILQRQKIDVIVCDVLMVPENGLDYCARLQKRRSRKPMILMSAQVSPVAMQDGIKAGASTYMMKPFSPEQFYQRIIEVLAARPQPKTHSRSLVPRCTVLAS